MDASKSPKQAQPSIGEQSEPTEWWFCSVFIGEQERAMQRENFMQGVSATTHACNGQHIVNTIVESDLGMFNSEFGS